MAVEYIRYRMAAHTPEALIAAYGDAATHLDLAPECLGYELTRCVEDPACLILRIEWTSTRAHLEGFRRGPHFPPFLAAIRPFIGEIEEMRHYELTDPAVRKG
ncbi:MAG: antibiotic biosynthesis monooxygenase [Alphaproteobacteria bacterium]|nr:antibiotic biosynthesis monooxygenase [Alphaproteobacteria bacterium]MBU1525746.1 antibiotic biosynthesis monooxygenase [Alphaproteobacteria bacterium]MBU2118397.1 antibiotic biosynthesis monooxygenase [Alphaproteobacteria bacterium]MBU2351873.1 antibiotic biosynthesis monooxygenase [Alphaproteobacteria bacterium]MBU2382727.1 antibiotic biosynthesis monooxygenase [Alphaproteobacteria bacterium]